MTGAVSAFFPIRECLSLTNRWLREVELVVLSQEALKGNVLYFSHLLSTPPMIIMNPHDSGDFFQEQEVLDLMTRIHT